MKKKADSNLAERKSDEGNKGNWGDLEANYLIDKLIVSLKEKHTKEGGTYNFFQNYVPATLKFAKRISLRGGFSESLLKKRLDYRQRQK